MADFLTAVKSVRAHDPPPTTDSELKVVTSPKVREDGSTKSSTGIQGRSKPDIQLHTKSLGSPEDVLQVLRSQPDRDELSAALQALHTQAFGTDFNLHAPGPLQSQIINAIINQAIPNFWPTLDSKGRRDVVLCLSNVAGFNAVIARLTGLNRSDEAPSGKDSQNIQQSDNLLAVSESMSKGSHVCTKVFQTLQVAVPAKIKRDMTWKDFANLLGSGKVISTLAQVHDRVQSSKEYTSKVQAGVWLTKGSEYTAWLGSNIADMLLADPDQSVDEAFRSTTFLLAKALTLGYSNALLLGFFRQVIPDLVSERLSKQRLQELFNCLPISSSRTFLEHLLRWMSTMSPIDAKYPLNNNEEARNAVRSLAILLSLVIGKEGRLFEATKNLLSDPMFFSTLFLPVRRACLAVVSQSIDAADNFQALLEKYMTTFNDPIFATHAPILQQQSLAQILLVTAGYVHRDVPMALLMIARSSNHMQGVSSRLNSSNVKSRWLGMIVATAISSLVDKEDAQMDFGTDDMQTAEAHWYLALVNVNDAVGTLKEFQSLLRSQASSTNRRSRTINTQPEAMPEAMPKLDGKPVFGPPRPPVQTEVIGEKVTEILGSDEESDQDGLKPYAKPDSDPEDSDEDATLVNRNKVKPPVYVRDLMSMLREDKNYDRFQLGIKNAAALIRRKTNFGAEVQDHAEEIASILCNLQDPFKTEDFNELKLQAMIAVLLSDVKTMAPWFSRQAFLGDYSTAQRCAILSALGLGGRELAGLKNEDELNPTLSKTDFPSKRLPTHLHSVYAVDQSSTKRLEAASKDIEQSLIKPMALQAADQSTAHLNAVKIRTFSSRMDVERTKRKPAPNALAKVFGEAFFFSLVNKYQQEIAVYSASSVYSSVAFLLVTFIKTLALLLHASGPATSGLIDISGEFWDLLLSLRVAALGDISILQAVLFSLLTLLEVNTDKQRIVQQHPQQLMETQQWVEMVFGRMGGGDSTSDNADEAKVQTLAAGVLVKTKEVIEAYQKELIGFSM